MPIDVINVNVWLSWIHEILCIDTDYIQAKEIVLSYESSNF